MQTRKIGAINAKEKTWYVQVSCWQCSGFVLTSDTHVQAFCRQHELSFYEYERVLWPFNSYLCHQIQCFVIIWNTHYLFVNLYIAIYFRSTTMRVAINPNPRLWLPFSTVSGAIEELAILVQFQKDGWTYYSARHSM